MAKRRTTAGRVQAALQPPLVPSPSFSPVLDPTPTAKDADAFLGPMLASMGITGTTNWFGDPLAEQNMGLTHAEGFGVPGSRTWGEWEKRSRTDPTIATVLQFITSPIRDARVEVVPPEHPAIPEKLAQQMTDHVRWCVEENVEPLWPDVLQQAAEGSLVYGHALHEVVLGVTEQTWLPGGQGYGLTKLAERLPVSVHAVNGWHEAKQADGSLDLDWIQQIGQTPDGSFSSTIRLPAEKVLLWNWKRTGNNYRGFSAFRPVIYIAKIRESLLKLTGISLMREGAGIPVGYSEGPDAEVLSEADREKYSRLLQNMVFHENAGVVMPKGWRIKWEFSGAGNKTHIIDVYNALGLLILQQLGAQQIHLGTGGTGSRAVGQTHQEVSQGYVQAVISGLEATLNGVGQRKYTGLPRKLCEPNWGPQSAWPKIRITLKKGSLSPLELAQAAQAAKSAGLLTPTLDDENTIRENLGLESITEEDRDAEKQKAASLIPQLQSGASPPGSPASPVPERPTSAPGKPGLSDEKPPAKAARLARDFTPWRALRPNEAVLDLSRMSKFLDNGRDKFATTVRPVVLEMLAAASPALTTALEQGKPGDVHRIALPTKRLRAVVDKFLTECRAEGRAEVTAELAKGNAKQVAQDRRNLAASDEEDDKGAEADADDVQEQVLDRVVRKMTQRLQGDLEDEAIAAESSGAEPSLVISRVLTDQMATGAFKGDAGACMTRLWNVGRDEAAKMLGGVAYVERSAILDENTCDACEAHDGETADFDSPEHDALLPPEKDCDGGNSCRCCVVYVPATGGEGEDDEG